MSSTALTILYGGHRKVTRIGANESMSTVVQVGVLLHGTYRNNHCPASLKIGHGGKGNSAAGRIFCVSVDLGRSGPMISSWQQGGGAIVMPGEGELEVDPTPQGFVLLG